MLRSIIYSLFGCVVFFVISSQSARLSEELCETKYVLSFSLQHLSYTLNFFPLGSLQRDIILSVPWTSCKCPIILSHVNQM